MNLDQPFIHTVAGTNWPDAAYVQAMKAYYDEPEVDSPKKRRLVQLEGWSPVLLLQCFFKFPEGD